MTAGSGRGIITFQTWPVYVGIAEGPGYLWEPLGIGCYSRGQIEWVPVSDDRQVIGRARIFCPPGEYTHLLYYNKPEGSDVRAWVPLPHTVYFHHGFNVIDVDPILNSDLTYTR